VLSAIRDKIHLHLRGKRLRSQKLLSDVNKIVAGLSTLFSKNVRLFIFLNNSQKLTDFNPFW